MNMGPHDRTRKQCHCRVLRFVHVLKAQQRICHASDFSCAKKVYSVHETEVDAELIEGSAYILCIGLGVI